jgi:hypothetical protein
MLSRVSIYASTLSISNTPLCIVVLVRLFNRSELMLFKCVWGLWRLLTFLCVRRSFFRLVWTRSVSSLTRFVRRTHEPSFTLFTQQCDHLLLLDHLLLTLCFASTLPGQVLLTVLLLAHLLATPPPSSRYALCYSLLCCLVCELSYSICSSPCFSVYYSFCYSFCSLRCYLSSATRSSASCYSPATRSSAPRSVSWSPFLSATFPVLKTLRKQICSIIFQAFKNTVVVPVQNSKIFRAMRGVESNTYDLSPSIFFRSVKK